MAGPLRSRNGDDITGNQNGPIIALTIVFTLLSLAALIARIVSLKMKSAPLRIEEYLLTAAWCLSATEGAIGIWDSVDEGLGHHTATVTPGQQSKFAKVLFAIELLQPTILALAKVSVVTLLQRIFVTRAFRITCIILNVVVVSWWIGIFFAQVFDCWPIESRWDPEIQATCGNQWVANIVAPIPWIVTDIAILVAPIPMIRKLIMPTRQKVAFGAIFLVGILTCIVSIARYREGFFSLNDANYDIAELHKWNIVEANITVMCAALVSSMPVFVFLTPDRLVSSMRSFLRRTLTTGRSGDTPRTGLGSDGASPSNASPSHRSLSKREPSNGSLSNKSLSHAKGDPTHTEAYELTTRVQPDSGV